ncbi:MAG: hypothetical protein Q9227_005271 [Pyrenula ochraceoflavens]
MSSKPSKTVAGSSKPPSGKDAALKADIEREDRIARLASRYADKLDQEIDKLQSKPLESVINCTCDMQGGKGPKCKGGRDHRKESEEVIEKVKDLERRLARANVFIEGSLKAREKLLPKD